ncbi:hypothetical protein L7F22_057886 [Adiantum nelumboides]|nr:hypothetical protein [Adiantum nelumboides]
MAGFFIPPVKMTLKHQDVTGQGVQMAPTSVPIMHTVSFDNLESMDKPKPYEEGGQSVQFDTFSGFDEVIKAFSFLEQFDKAFAWRNFIEASKVRKAASFLKGNASQWWNASTPLYTDFIVNEVDNEGNVVHLTCLDPSEEIIEGQSEALQDDQEDESLHVENHLDAFRFSFLVTDTVDGPDSKSKCVRVRILDEKSGSGRNKGKRMRDLCGKNKGKRQKHDGCHQGFDSRGADDNWPSQRGKYLQFHLYKENKDTQDALMVVGKMLGMQPKSFGIAGTKDKRAVTTQRGLDLF